MFVPQSCSCSLRRVGDKHVCLKAPPLTLIFIKTATEMVRGWRSRGNARTMIAEPQSGIRTLALNFAWLETAKRRQKMKTWNVLRANAITRDIKLLFSWCNYRCVSDCPVWALFGETKRTESNIIPTHIITRLDNLVFLQSPFLASFFLLLDAWMGK